MNGLREIKAANAPKRDTAEEYRVQRDRIAQCLRRVLKGEDGAAEMAQRVLTQVYGAAE